MKLLKFFTLFLFLYLQCLNAFSFDLDIEFDSNDKNNKQIFYNEKIDCEDGECRKDKNYAKIGSEEYVQDKIFRKFYIGVDINWYLKRFGDLAANSFALQSGGKTEYNPTLYSKELWDRFRNFDIYFGFRVFKYFGFDVGYANFGNLFSQYMGYEYFSNNGENYAKRGIFADILVYTPPVFLFKKISVEGYASVGGIILFSKLNDNKGIAGAKFGAGLLVGIYSAFAINVGVDYYYPLKDISKLGIDFSRKGLLSIKTGFNFYLNI